MHALSRVIMLVAAIIVVAPVRSAAADDLACVSTTFRFIGANDKVCVSAFDDPKVEGIACHISQARTGGVKGSLGLAEDPSRFSIACRQVGPITADLAKLPEDTPPALSVLQAHPDLPDTGQEAEHACLRCDQRQNRRGLTPELDIHRPGDAVGPVARDFRQRCGCAISSEMAA